MLFFFGPFSENHTHGHAHTHSMIIQVRQALHKVKGTEANNMCSLGPWYGHKNDSAGKKKKMIQSHRNL